MTYPFVFLRARRLCARDGFEPAEAFRLGLFRSRDQRRQPAECVSRRRLREIQQSLNPIDWAPLLLSTDLFYRYCMAIEVPIPQLYAIHNARLPGWTYTGHLLRTRGDWTAFLDGSLPVQFVVKPVDGAHRQGSSFFRRTGKGYMDAAGTYLETGGLYDMLVSNAADRHIIQEQVHNHAELTRLSGTEMLQVVRIITLVDDDGQVHILHAHLTITRKDEAIAPSVRGLIGDIEAPIDLPHGTLGPANRIPGTGAMPMAVPVHPETKITFKGVRLPFWAEACQLVRQTAVKFIPIRTIGWDIALTPNGPVVVEGNIWWDPPHQHGGVGEILRVLSVPSVPRTQQSGLPPGDRSHWHDLFAGDR